MRPSRSAGFVPPARYVVAVLCLLGLVLRLAGLDSELWFDEIVTVRSVAKLGTLWRTLTATHTDNKHHLIWAWVWLVGPRRPEWLYRLPSLLAGVGLLPLVYVVVRRSFGASAAVLALAVSACCEPLVAYSTEARGYALAALAGVTAHAVAPRDDRVRPGHSPRPPVEQRDLRSPGQGNGLVLPRWAAATTFNVLIVAGFASHLTFAYVYAGLLAWAAVDVVRRPRWATTVLAWHGPAAAVLLVFWWTDVRHLTYAGGPPTSAATVLAYLAAAVLGTPTAGPLPWVAVGATAALAGRGLAVLVRRRDWGPSAFFLAATVAAPAVLTVTRRTPFLAVRYYLVAIPFVIVLASAGVASLPKLPRRAVATLSVGLTAIAGGNRAWQLATIGRGHAAAAVARMAAAGVPITVASQRPVMDDLTLGYYAGPTPILDRSATDDPPQWWILDLDDPSQVGQPTVEFRGRPYRLDAAYPAVPPALTWDLYRRRQSDER